MTIVMDRAEIVDKCSAARTDAGRPQPPPAVVIVDVYKRSLGNCIFCGLALSCATGRKILFRFFDAEQEHFVVRCIAGRSVIIGILVGRNGCSFYLLLFFIAEGIVDKGFVQPLA